MRSSADASTSQNGRRVAGNTTVNNNNNNTGNSGSQYALCALGVGLVALGIVMIVWSVVPADPSGNHSVSHDPDPTGKKSKASSVAFVLVGSGVAVLLLSLCLGMRNKQREQQYLQRQQQAQTQATTGRPTLRWRRSRPSAMQSHIRGGRGQRAVSSPTEQPATQCLPASLLRGPGACGRTPVRV
ncbi:hypothetical protein WMY93_022017 [Mugilogobius chulae]|uniref:Transmembrane protein 51 n=1 Tax=Mugilogobius chulae TaxID=88201 RepID=A0AAW0NCC4_9GOBI